MNNENENLQNLDLEIEQKIYTIQNKAKELYQQEKYEDCLKCYELITELNPKSNVAFLNIGQVYEKLGNQQKALENYDISIGLDQSYADAYSYKGTLLSEQKNYLEASKCFELTIQKDPLFKAAYFNLGSAYFNLQQYEKAIDTFNLFIQNEPEFGIGESYFFIAISLKNLKQYDQALKAYDEASKIYPNSVLYLSQKAELQMNMENYEECIETLDKIIKLETKLPLGVLLFKSRALLNLKKLDESLLILDDLIQQGFLLSECYQYKSTIYWLKEDKKTSLFYIEKALSLDPKNKQYQNMKKFVELTDEQRKELEQKQKEQYEKFKKEQEEKQKNQEK